MTTSDDCFQELHTKIECSSHSLQKWKCNFWFNEASSVTEEPKMVDLCSFLLPPHPHNPDFPHGSNYMFPSHFTGVDSRQQLIAELKIAALKCGFSLVITTSQNLQRSSSDRLLLIRLGCKHSIRFQSGASSKKDASVINKAKTKVTYTNRAEANHETCPFTFIIFLQKDTSAIHPNRWFLGYKKGLDAISQYNNHKNHFKLDTNLISSSMELLTEQERKLIKNCGQLSMQSNVTAALLSQSCHETTGIGWNTKQIYWMNYKERLAIADLSPNASSASKIIKSFEDRNDVSYVMLTFNPNHGLIAKRTRGRPCKLSSVLEEDSELLSQMFESNKFERNNNEQMLLIFMFASDQEIWQLYMHPEVAMIDTTFKTNRQKKELLTIAFVDGNNMGFNGARAYIPSASQWVFKYAFNHCLRLLWGDEIMKRIKLAITDGDTNEYEALHAAISTKVLPNAVHRLCFFHKFSQGWIQFVSKFIPDNNGAKYVALQVKQWICTWYLSLESKSEYVYSRKCFFDWLRTKTDILSELFVEKVEEFILKRLDPYDFMCLNYLYLHINGLNQRTTSIAESMHRSMKSGLQGVGPSMDAHVSAMMMIDKAEKRQIENARNNAQQIQRKRVSEFKTNNDISFLTKYMQDVMEEQYLLKGKYHVVAKDRDTFLVFRSEDDHKERAKNKAARDPAPLFVRVRQVQRINNKYLHCSCGFPSRMRAPCRHILAMVNTIHPYMFAIRWLIMYQFSYKRGPAYEETDNVFQQLVQQEQSRGAQEAVFVGSAILNFAHDEQFPVMVTKQTAECDWIFAQKILSMGLSASLTICEMNAQLIDLDVTTSSDTQNDVNVSSQHSVFATDIIADVGNVEEIQDMQFHQISELSTTAESSYNRMLSWTKDIHKLVEHDKEATERACFRMQQIYMDFVQEFSTKRNATVESTTMEDYFLPFSGKETKKSNKRYRSAYEK